MTGEEKAFCAEYRKSAGIRDGETVVGFNTGCSELYPNKKLTIDQHVRLIRALSSVPNVKLVLVGGPEDTERNAEIARIAGDAVINTPTTEGVRRGLCYENICDAVVTGDSFGMHAAIGLEEVRHRVVRRHVPGRDRSVRQGGQDPARRARMLAVLEAGVPVRSRVRSRGRSRRDPGPCRSVREELRMNNILIVRTDRLGDVLLTTPVSTALRRDVPRAQDILAREPLHGAAPRA